jgi:hypothetical protein
MALILFSLGLGVYSQDFTNFHFSEGGEHDSSIIFCENKVIFYTNFINLPEITDSTYSYSVKNGITFLTIRNDPDIRAILLYNNEFGILSLYSPVKADTGIMVQYSGNTNIYPFSRSKEGPAVYSIDNPHITTSSYFIQNGRSYTGENVKKSAFDGPWVEGVDGYGHGEYIELDYSKTEGKEVNAIVISNGFVSYNDPALYEKNNRLKRIVIEAEGTDLGTIDLADTPNLQTIRLGGYYSKIKIRIISVYEGTDWDDTCVNMILGLKL